MCSSRRIADRCKAKLIYVDSTLSMVHPAAGIAGPLLALFEGYGCDSATRRNFVARILHSTKLGTRFTAGRIYNLTIQKAPYPHKENEPSDAPVNNGIHQNLTVPISDIYMPVLNEGRNAMLVLISIDE